MFSTCGNHDNYYLSAWEERGAIQEYLHVCVNHRGLEWDSWNKYAIKYTPPSSPALCTLVASSPYPLSPTPGGIKLSEKTQNAKTTCATQPLHMMLSTSVPC